MFCALVRRKSSSQGPRVLRCLILSRKSLWAMVINTGSSLGSWNWYGQVSGFSKSVRKSISLTWTLAACSVFFDHRIIHDDILECHVIDYFLVLLRSWIVEVSSSVFAENSCPCLYLHVLLILVDKELNAPHLFVRVDQKRVAWSLHSKCAGRLWSNADELFVRSRHWGQRS